MTNLKGYKQRHVLKNMPSCIY